MKQNKLLNKIIFPPTWIIVISVIISIAGMIFITCNDFENNPISYVIFAIATYALTVFCIFAAKKSSQIYRKTKANVYNHPLGNKYMTDISFKVRVSLFGTLIFNLAYSIFKLITGIVYSSFWWVSIAVYYIMLSLMRFILLRYMHLEKEQQNLLKEYRSFQFCGILFFILNIALSEIVALMVVKNERFAYPEGLILIAAMYAFYNIIVSVIDMIRYRNHNSPVILAAKAVRFAAALVSMLSLETSMLTVFGNSLEEYKTLTSATGIGICVIVLAMSLYMIISPISKMKKIQQNMI